MTTFLPANSSAGLTSAPPSAVACLMVTDGIFWPTSIMRPVTTIPGESRLGVAGFRLTARRADRLARRGGLVARPRQRQAAQQLDRHRRHRHTEHRRDECDRALDAMLVLAVVDAVHAARADAAE